MYRLSNSKADTTKFLEERKSDLHPCLISYHTIGKPTHKSPHDKAIASAFYQNKANTLVHLIERMKQGISFFSTLHTGSRLRN